MSILQMSLSIPVTPNSLSSAEALSGGPISARSLCFTTKLTQLSLTIPISLPYKTTPIRMGGGPRTFPGGVSKWQWKKMQAKKAKQLLRARLARERQIYEMRKRAELKADIFELERPWETVEKPPHLFSVGADEQLKVLADRFQKPGGLDLWSERDGPELFRHDNGLPSARFFPKGVVHSIKPYRKTEELATPSEEFRSSGLEEDLNPSQISEKVEKMDLRGNRNSRSNQSGSDNGGNVTNLGTRSLNGVGKQGEIRNFKGEVRDKGSTRTYSSDSEGKNHGNARFHNRDDRRSDSSGEFRRNGYKSDQSMNSEGKNYGNARFHNRDDRRSRRPGENSGEFRRSNGYKSEQSMNSEGKKYGSARFDNRDDRRSGRPSDSSAEFRRSNSYKKDQSMNSDGKKYGNASGEFRRSNSYKKSEVFDLNLHNDGSYGFELGNIDDAIDSACLGR